MGRFSFLSECQSRARSQNYAVLIEGSLARPWKWRSGACPPSSRRLSICHDPLLSSSPPLLSLRFSIFSFCLSLVISEIKPFLLALLQGKEVRRSLALENQLELCNTTPNTSPHKFLHLALPPAPRSRHHPVSSLRASMRGPSSVLSVLLFSV